MNFKQVLNKNKVLSFNGLITNSVSTTRSINEDPIKFEKCYDIFTLLDAQTKKFTYRYEIIRKTDKRTLTQSVIIPTGRTPEIPVSGPSSFSNHL